MIERSFCVKRDDFGLSLWGFVRGLYGVLGLSRVICWMFGWGFTPILEVIETKNELDCKSKEFAGF